MIKDIAVHLTGSPEDATRLAHAAGVARVFDAHVTGLQLHELPELLAITDPSGSEFLRQLIEQSNQRAQAVGAVIERQCDELGLRHELRRLDAYPGRAGQVLAAAARQSDLFLGTRPYGDPGKAEWIEETVMFESGRPCLFIPPGYPAGAEFRNILVAWKDTREAARAVADALPFLRKAGSVVVAIVEEGPASEREGRAPAGDIGRYLSRHGVKAEVHVVNGWNKVGDAILNEGVRTGAHLIVMGAYGHSRVREWILGGATREVLSHASIPVLVAH